MCPFPERPLRRYTLPLALLLGASSGLLLPHNPRFENVVNRAHSSASLDSRLLLVRIDDATLNDYGLLPQWPRQLYALAIDTLEQAGAAVIGLDVVLGSAGEQDAAVQRTFSQPNLVLATAPGDTRVNVHPDWKAATGVSALNDGSGAVRQFQTAYATGGDPLSSNLSPSFARQVAARAGHPVALDTRPQLLRYVPTQTLESQAISFRDLINGNVRYADLQGRIVLIGQDASGVAGVQLPDIDGRRVSGLTLQARAVLSLLAQPIRALPQWAIALLCAAVAGLAVLLGGLWGYALAGLTLFLPLLLWNLNLTFPGVTVSFSAILGASLVAFERWWQLRTLRVRDQLTGLGNRLAFTRAVEKRCAAHNAPPFALALVDLSGLRRVNDALGRPTGDALLREVASRLQRAKRRNDMVFRWGGDEFALLLDQVGDSELQAVTQKLEQALTPLSAGQIPVRVTVGLASSSGGPCSPDELIEAASRQRYRAKYQRVQEG